MSEAGSPGWRYFTTFEESGKKKSIKEETFFRNDLTSEHQYGITTIWEQEWISYY
jgi:hypothetical protein